MTAVTWLFSYGTQHEQFRTKASAMKWIKAAGWELWAGKRELMIFVRGVESASLRRSHGMQVITE